ncbi:single-stranded DNA-binding protein [Companilactobacillus futsaii]|uniref:Single-stranded DNA-binding protein n=2 Tax=Companilactobacillus futsaii TaxID=938155 RepID=A0A5B7SVJ6_9LACO|nr:single-stranded DNA-binding protein [Companilactobacillus futsaii]KRK94204.1 single-strand DNA binding protein [Companilactobacillus futsaii JCM 17355]QCX24016.1 single-stranded DNA-binding protein [Companilactobacillus futsaii]
MINRVVLVGRLTRDSELRYTTSGNAVSQFNLAVNRQFTNSQGEREADFINCVIWRKAAENFTNFTHKGSLVGIDGRVQTRNYENQQDQRVYVTEVVVENFSLLESRSDANNQQQNSSSTNDYSHQPPKKSRNDAANAKSDVANSRSGDPFANNSKPIDISDDDLPF